MDVCTLVCLALEVVASSHTLGRNESAKDERKKISEKVHLLKSLKSHNICPIHMVSLT